MGYKLIDRQVLYEGKKVRLEIHHLDDDSGKRHRREVCVHPGAVVVLPFVDDNTILLIRNRRYTVGKILVELPAGTMEKGEDPINCAGRELQEETGYIAGKLQSIGSFFASPGILTEKMYAYAAYDLEQSRQVLDEGEEIELAATAYDDAIEMIREGIICDAKTIATLLMYDRFNRNRE